MNGTPTGQQRGNSGATGRKRSIRGRILNTPIHWRQISRAQLRPLKYASRLTLEQEVKKKMPKSVLSNVHHHKKKCLGQRIVVLSETACNLPCSTNCCWLQDTRWSMSKRTAGGQNPTSAAMTMAVSGRYYFIRRPAHGCCKQICPVKRWCGNQRIVVLPKTPGNLSCSTNCYSLRDTMLLELSVQATKKTSGVSLARASLSWIAHWRHTIGVFPPTGGQELFVLHGNQTPRVGQEMRPEILQ